ncbi:hypothetical protein BCEP4_60126 [Burkholderia cepacia]|nr:hypothetical protein BCEP4_60126 [Burkholderia cepacia]
MAKPNWPHWADPDMEFWTPEQAICLSLDIDPDQPVPEHKRTRYAQWLRELQGAIKAKSEHLRVRNGEIRRFEFVFWASQCKEWPDLPPELMSIAELPIPEIGEPRQASHAADRVDANHNGWRKFSLEDSDAPAIDCEKYIQALVQAKYQDGPDLAPEENDAIREAGAEVLRQSVEAAARQGALQPRGRDMLPMLSGIPRREQLEPFSNLYFERESFAAFTKEAWLVSEADDAPPEQDEQLDTQQIALDDLAWMIAVQRADRGISHAHGLDERDGVRRSIEIALQVRGWAPDGIPGVIPEIAKMAQARIITLHGPLETASPEAAQIAANPGAWWLTTDDVQHVLAALCPSVRRYTVNDIADIIAKRVHSQNSEAERALWSSLVERMGHAIEQGELIANERRKDGEVLLNEHAVDEWCAREQFPFRLGLTAQADADKAAMEAAGRHTIDAVVGELAKKTGRDAARWEATLVAEIKSGALPLKNPRDLGDFLPYPVPKNLRTFYDRVDISDVDKLLDTRPDWRVTYRFRTEAAAAPASAVEVDAAPAKPPLQQRHQENEILRVIRELGEDPARLPKQTPGKPGIKAAVRAKLAFSGKVFDLAWERLRKNGEIADAQ